jgi:hypothetical protein
VIAAASRRRRRGAAPRHRDSSSVGAAAAPTAPSALQARTPVLWGRACLTGGGALCDGDGDDGLLGLGGWRTRGRGGPNVFWAWLAMRAIISVQLWGVRCYFYYTDGLGPTWVLRRYLVASGDVGLGGVELDADGLAPIVVIITSRAGIGVECVGRNSSPGSVSPKLRYYAQYFNVISTARS